MSLNSPLSSIRSTIPLTAAYAASSYLFSLGRYPFLIAAKMPNANPAVALASTYVSLLCDQVVPNVSLRASREERDEMVDSLVDEGMPQSCLGILEPYESVHLGFERAEEILPDGVVGGEVNGEGGGCGGE